MRKFVGVQCLYEDFELEGGEMFLFEFNGSDGFNVYIIGKDFCEIDYPQKVHQLQKCIFWYWFLEAPD